MIATQKKNLIKNWAEAKIVFYYKDKIKMTANIVRWAQNRRVQSPNVISDVFCYEVVSFVLFILAKNNRLVVECWPL